MKVTALLQVLYHYLHFWSNTTLSLVCSTKSGPGAAAAVSPGSLLGIETPGPTTAPPCSILAVLPHWNRLPKPLISHHCASSVTSAALSLSPRASVLRENYWSLSPGTLLPLHPLFWSFPSPLHTPFGPLFFSLCTCSPSDSLSILVSTDFSPISPSHSYPSRSYLKHIMVIHLPP